MASTKTLGSTSANLISSLYDLNKTVFNLQDIKAITGLNENAASDLASKMAKRKIIARLRPGKYIIVPQEMGRDINYIGNWYVAAREIVKSPDYYISYYSAMDIHNMVTHPVTKVFVSTPEQEYKKKKITGGVTFEFICIGREYIWGIKKFWVTKSEQVRVSDIERTVLDCLYRPQYCGGILEISKGLWMQKQKIDFDKLFNYAARFNRIVAIKRLGYILESLRLQNSEYLDKLRAKINDRYYALDPLLTVSQTYKNSWKCIANISPQEIRQAVST